jgi:hypothetical protein
MEELDFQRFVAPERTHIWESRQLGRRALGVRHHFLTERSRSRSEAGRLAGGPVAVRRRKS